MNVWQTGQNRLR